MRYHFRRKTDKQHSAQTHTPDNAPRASMQCVNEREVRDKKKKKGKKRNERNVHLFPSPTSTPSRFCSINPP